MIKVCVFYPGNNNAGSAGKSFDMAYYTEIHMPLVRRMMGPACLGVGAESGISGMTDGSAAEFVAVGYMLFESVEDFQASWAKAEAVLMGDVSNYTHIEPIIQISSVDLWPQFGRPQ